MNKNRIGNSKLLGHTLSVLKIKFVIKEMT